MKTTTSTVSNKKACAPRATHSSDADYEQTRVTIQTRITMLRGPLFFTEATGLSSVFLRNIPANARQYYNCTACKDFIERYGAIVNVENGEVRSPLWRVHVAPFFRKAFEALQKRVEGAAVRSVFLTSTRVWGTPQTKTWSHFAGRPPGDLIYGRNLLTAEQVMAQKLENFKMLCHGLQDYGPTIVENALIVLRGNALSRGETVLGVAEWLDRLHKSLKGLTGPRRENVIWEAVATAPAGFCRVRSTRIHALLDDLTTNGHDLAGVARRWKAVVDPLKDHRAQVPPKAGNIVQAEKVVERLRSAGSLNRRFALLSDLQLLWRPRPQPGVPTATGTGVFGHIQPKGAKGPAPSSLEAQLPPQTMTWVKFRDEVLPQAWKIELLVPSGPRNFSALVTAADPTAPNMLQWDNPVSWYVYHGGSGAGQWNLRHGAWRELTGITLQPSMWDGTERHKQHGQSVFLLIHGAHDTGHIKSGGLFPSLLRSDYHPIRATLEAHFNEATIRGKVEAEGCGLRLDRAANWDQRVRVNDGRVYILDRWD